MLAAYVCGMEVGARLASARPKAALSLLAAMSHMTRKADELLRTRVSRNVDVETDEKLTLFQRASDAISAFSGSFAFLLGRLENAWRNKDTARGRSAHPPSHYLDRFCVDACVFDDRALAFLEKAGLVHRIESENAFVGCARPEPGQGPALDLDEKERSVGQDQGPLGKLQSLGDDLHESPLSAAKMIERRQIRP